MILVTGANGFLGAHICETLVKLNQPVKALVRKHADTSLLKSILHSIEIVEGDVLDTLSLKKAIENCTGVIHTAAIVSFWPLKRESMYLTNVEGTKNIVDVLIDQPHIRLIHVSSIAALGRSQSNPIVKENQPWVESDENTHYAKSKYLADLEVVRGWEEGLSGCIVYPSVILGAHINKLSTTRLFEYVKSGATFYPLGYMNYIDVDDVVQRILFLMKNKEINHESFILNADKILYKSFFEKIAQALKVKAPSKVAKQWMKTILWRIQHIISLVTKKEPLITKETATVSNTQYSYDTTKINAIYPQPYKSIDSIIQEVTSKLY
jgi:nucleoside-diphosphate-sugar epimerase